MTKTTEEGIQWLDEQLRLAGIDRSELARRGDFNSSALTHVYAGRRNVGPKIAKGIARGLSVSPEIVFREFGLMDEGEDRSNDDETKLFAELLNDIEDENEKRKAVGIVTAILRQIAHTTRQSKPRAADKGTGKRSKPA
jgi:hypothetical protein